MDQRDEDGAAAESGLGLQPVAVLPRCKGENKRKRFPVTSTCRNGDGVHYVEVYGGAGISNRCGTGFTLKEHMEGRGGGTRFLDTSYIGREPHTPHTKIGTLQ